jgi:hypothetical protein
MAYVTPRTWTTGELATAAMLNQDVRDNVAFLANPPACRVYHNATQTVATSTRTALAFNTERYDTAAMHDTATNNSRITFPVAGLYLITGHVEWALNADPDGLRQLEIRANGSDSQILAIQGSVFNPASTTLEQSISTVHKFAAAEYVQLTAFQNSGSTFTINSVVMYSPEFSATWIGLG